MQRREHQSQALRAREAPNVERNVCFHLVLSNGKSFEKQREGKETGRGRRSKDGREERAKQGGRKYKERISSKLGQHH